MTIKEATENVGKAVKYLTADDKGGNGRIVGVHGRKVLVKVWGRHRKTELVEPDRMRLWKARNGGA